MSRNAPYATPTTRLVTLAASWAALASCGIAAADIIFVNAATVVPAGLQNGNSWAFAYKSLQDGIADAQAGDEIWVAQGTYRPTTGTDRTVSFLLPDDVRVLGGFLPGAGSVSDRDPLAHPTILSGNIGGPGSADNSFHVVRMTGGICTLSGFHITGGLANGTASDAFGGGMRIASNARITECLVYGNSSNNGGGGIFGVGSGDITIVNCIVTGNTGGIGGGIEFQGATGRVFFSTVVHNAGGGIRYLNSNGSGMVANSIVRGNTGSGSTLANQLTIQNATVSVAGSNIEAGIGAGISMIDADPLFLDADGADGVLGTVDDNYDLRGDSPCIDRGSAINMPADFGDVDGDGSTAEPLSGDLALRLRRIDDPLSTATGLGSAPYPDMGAFEFARPRTVLVDHTATGANNGTSWEDAYTDLQDAIFELNDVKFGGDGEIWVAQGDYKPTSTANQAISFLPGSGTRMFGGFAGGELTRAARDPGAHETVLSGDIGPAGPAGNSEHVLSFTGPFTTDIVVDGFTIRDGVAGSGQTGAGVRIINDATPTISGCLITKNASNAGGSAVHIAGGAGVTPTLINCVIVGNTAGGTGTAGVLVSGTAARLVNCTIAGNTNANALAAGVALNQSSASLRNTLIFDNGNTSGSLLPAQVSSAASTASLHHCAIQNWVNGSLAGASVFSTFAIGVFGEVVDADGLDDVYGTADDDLTPTGCSLLVDAGTVPLIPGDVADINENGNTAEAWPLDFAVGSRLVDLPAPNVIGGLNGRVDIGAIELQAQPLADSDFDDDGDVDAADPALLLGAWASFGSAFDLNGDCIVDAADLAIVLGDRT